MIVTRSRSLEDIDVVFAPWWEPWWLWPARLVRRGGVGRTSVEEVVATSCDGESARRGIGENLAREMGGRRHVQGMIYSATWRNVDIRTRFEDIRSGRKFTVKSLLRTINE